MKGKEQMERANSKKRIYAFNPMPYALSSLPYTLSFYHHTSLYTSLYIMSYILLPLTKRQSVIKEWSIELMKNVISNVTNTTTSNDQVKERIIDLISHAQTKRPGG